MYLVYTTNMGTESLDVLAIGDIVVDDFIRLKEASVHCKLDNDECEICMRWGDKIPFEFSVRVPGVGNAANAAVCAARLGLKSALHTYVGADIFGDECIESLTKDQVSTVFVEKVPEKHTNYHYVLWYESERTILIKHEQFTYQFPTLTVLPSWIYLSSLAAHTLPYHDAIAVFLTAHPEIKLAFQPGTFQIGTPVEQLHALYQRSAIFFCNKEEAMAITGTTTPNVTVLLAQLQALGPKIVIITDGREGAYCLTEDGTQYFVPLYPDPRPPYERTGAGDAFSAAVVSALALGKPLEEALLWGPISSMSVVQAIGAQKGLLTRMQMDQYLHHAPAEYAIKKL